MTKEFFAGVLTRQVQRVLRDHPDLQDNPNGLILAVWKEEGLRLKRRQPVSSFLLSSVDEIVEAVSIVTSEEPVVSTMRVRSGSIDGMDYEVDPREPKPKRKKAKKIKVTSGKKK